MLYSVMTPRWTNQYIWRASQKSRGASAGTRSQTAAILSSSARRAGSFSPAASSRALAAWRRPKAMRASQLTAMALSSSCLS